MYVNDPLFEWFFFSTFEIIFAGYILSLYSYYKWARIMYYLSCVSYISSLIFYCWR
jgi:hypothetical protein